MVSPEKNLTFPTRPTRLPMASLFLQGPISTPMKTSKPFHRPAGSCVSRAAPVSLANVESLLAEESLADGPLKGFKWF